MSTLAAPADMRTIRRLLDTAVLLDNRLNAKEVAPDGGDYNNLFSLVSSVREIANRSSDATVGLADAVRDFLAADAMRATDPRYDLPWGTLRRAFAALNPPTE